MLLSAVLGCGLLLAQAVSGSLVGTITDVTGAVVPNAKVVLIETNTGVSRTTTANESGNYQFPNLPPGTYSVTIEQTGFKKITRPGIDVQVDTAPRIDVILQPGNVSESIEVSAEAMQLQTESASTGTQIATILTSNLPLGTNRNFQSLLNLVPGTAPATFQHSQFFNAASSLQTEVNGQMRQGNNYMIEGTDDNERTGLLQILIPPAEAIQTVDVSTSNHDPELGRASGAVMNVILKSGTNDYHGAAYWFLQNSDFNARSFFNPSVGHLAYNYVGGDIGGPIKKNKIFFFADYLRIMDHEANTNLVTIPSLANRIGDLSAAPTQIYNPFTGNPDGTGRVPFPNNQIPASLINPVSAKILSLIPAPNQSYKESAPANNYFALLPFQKTADSLDAKVDDNLTDKDRFSVRFSFTRPVVFQAPLFGDAGGDGPGGAFMGTGVQRTFSGGINYDRVISPTLVTEARLAVSYYHNEAQPSDYGKNDAASVGIPGINVSQFTSGMVGISIGNYSSPLVGYSASLPWVRAEVNVDLVNTWTKTIGNHTIKWGVDLKRIRDDLLQDQTYSPRGIYNFGENQTSIPGAKTGFGNDMASFLLDQPSSAGRDINTYFPAYRQWNFFAFAGDKWVVTPKLTLDLGLRWEFYPPAVPAFNGGFSNYDPTNNNLVLAGIGGNPKNLGMKTRYDYFAPRFGVAYRFNEKTVLRTGFGMSYTPFPDNTYAYNYPVRANTSYNTVGNGYGPAVLADGVTPATFQQGFPIQIPIPIPSNGIIPANTPQLLAQSYNVINTSFKNPYVESWNISVQRELPFNFVLDTAYVGSHGVDTVSTYNLNANTTIGSGAAGQPLNQAFKKTAGVTLYFAGYSSSYNSLQAKLNRRGRNFFMTTAFTYGKGMDYQQGDDGGLTFYIDQRRNYSRTDFDRTYTFVQSYVYQLPWGKGQRFLNNGLPASILGNWQLSGVLSIYSGFPVTITANGGSLNTPGSTQTADQVSDVQILHGIGVGNPWFSTSSFAQPTGVRFGTSGRNIFSGPNLYALNLSLFKNFQITERFKAEFRLETFNITNTPEFTLSGANSPQISLTSSTFGYITQTLGTGTGVNGTGGGRALQLGLKINF
ncbi:MAG: TonB-dependent receptor [Acidobacteriaceae bacterium]|nr:TonB-dependent receptor [Acidobacteriaceae bacterium]